MHQTDGIIREIKKAITGKDEVIAKVLMAILSEGHVLMEDVPGVGKTTLAVAFAKTLGLAHRRVQFTPDTLPSDIVGFSIYDKAQNTFCYQEGAVMTNLLLADEINRTSSRTQAALLEAMEELQITVDHVTYALPRPFVVLATQNPAGSAGTQLLPASQLDRFLICISMGYPDRDSLVEILKERRIENPLSGIQQQISQEELLHMQEQVRKVHVEDSIYEYIARLAENSGNDSRVVMGLSPRGALALCRMAKAAAFTDGRTYVTPEDVKQVFADVCGHRLILSDRAKLAAERPQGILTDILKATKMPGIGWKR